MSCGHSWYTRASPMRDALNRTRRPIQFMNEPMYTSFSGQSICHPNPSICPCLRVYTFIVRSRYLNPVEDVRWLMNVADQTWYDIKNNWAGVLTNADNNERWWKIAGCRDDGSGCYWNGPDYLEVGNGKLNPAEERSHFASKTTSNQRNLRSHFVF